MAEALETEVRNRYRLHATPGTQPVSLERSGDLWEDEDLWRAAKKNEIGNSDRFKEKIPAVEEEKETADRPDQKKRQNDNGKEELMPLRQKPSDDIDPRKEVVVDRGMKDLSNHFDDLGRMLGRDKRLSTKSIVGSGPDSALKRFAQPGVEENEGRSAALGSLMPNFVRRPREKPTHIPVEMQIDY